MRSRVLVFFALAASVAQAPSALFGTQPSSTVSVTPIGNSPINGRIVSWDFPGDLFIAIDGGKDSHFNATDVDNVQPLAACTAAIPRGPKTASAPVAPADWIVRLADSSQVLGNISGGDDERLLLHNADFGEIELPIERIDRLWRRAGREPPPAGDEDVVEMVNGDRLRGVMAGAEKGILRLSEGGDERPLAWEKIQTVALAAAKRGEPAGLSADIRLCDGSRFMSPKFNWKVGELHASFASMENLVIPDKLLIAIEVNGGRRKWLSDLPVEKYEAAPYFETQWGYRIDQNVLGGPLVLAGRTYRCGVGLHSACRITWNLGGAYQRLTALVGIDDSAGPHADADVIIRLDDREVLVLHGLRFGEAPRTIDLPVTGGDRLTIEVGFGKRGDVQDRVNVANAALIRK